MFDIITYEVMIMPMFDKTKDPEEIIDFTKNTIVPVICSYDIHGKCVPLYFGITHPNGDQERIKIDYVRYDKPNSCFGTVYFCDITVNDCQVAVYLYFHVKLNQWSLRNS
jgi:hypothetical protein